MQTEKDRLWYNDNYALLPFLFKFILTACISLISLWYLMMVLLSFSFSDLSSSCSFLFSFSFRLMSVSLPRRLPPPRTSFRFMISASLLTAWRHTLGEVNYACLPISKEMHTNFMVSLLPEFSVSSLTAAAFQTLASSGWSAAPNPLTSRFLVKKKSVIAINVILITTFRLWKTYEI